MRLLRSALSATVLVLVFGAAPVVHGAEAQANRKAASKLKLASSLFEAGRLGEALSTIEKAIDEDPKYAPAHLLKGMILFKLGTMEDSLKAFERTLDLQKGYTDARIWKATVLVQLERYDDAMREYETSLKDLTYPTPERIHCNIGMLYRLRGDTDAAIKSLLTAVNLNRSYARGYYELGVTYEQIGKNDEALRAYQDARVGMNDDPALNLRLALALLRSGDGSKAKEHFEKVIKLQPNGPEAAQARDQLDQLQKKQPAS